MKKLIGMLAVTAAAAGIVAYKVIKDNKKEVIVKENEEDIEIHEVNVEEDEEEEEQQASFATASYPNLHVEDMVHLNEVSEHIFETMEACEEERPIQHVLHFDDEANLKEFKNRIIEEGYVVTSGETNLDLVALHISKVDTDLILSKVFYLANLAKDYNGTYVNWILK